MINFVKAEQVFKKYVSNYDLEDDKIKLKLIHTYGVVNLSEFIAKDLKLDEENIELAKLIALLHDIGRFEQLKQCHNFDNTPENDHAEYGVKVLFEEKMIEEFVEDRKYDQIIYNSIKYHNKYKLPEELKGDVLLHSQLIRDSDKADNFRVKNVETIETLLDISAEQLGSEEISDIIYNQYMNKELIYIPNIKTNMDSWLSYLAFIFDFNFPSGLKYIMENDYLNKAIDRIKYSNKETKEKMEDVRRVSLDYIEKRIKENK